MFERSVMMSKILPIAFILTCLAGVASQGLATPASAETFALIVNADKDYTDERAQMIAQIRRLYLKEQRDWPGGADAIAFARPENTPEDSAFRRVILELKDAELEAYWLRLKQTQGETPPRAIGSSRIVLRQVSRRQGAFSIVTLDDLGAAPGVKVLFKFEGGEHE